MKSTLTDEQVEIEIEKLLKDEAVMLAKKEARLKYRRRQYLYCLRNLQKHGTELMEAGITMDK